MRVRRKHVALVAIVAVTAATLALALPALYPTVYGRKTIDDRLAEYGPAARARLSGDFAAAGVAYPPRRVLLVGFKRERELHLFAAGADGAMRHVRACSIRGASGVEGPKLREGDRQVPEGVYRIKSLNPNSRFHLSLRVGYPNDFDRAMAASEGRTALGSDIMIHGGSASIGCLAMGDEAAEELFVLAADVGVGNVRAVLAPCDLRTAAPELGREAPRWYATLCDALRSELAGLPGGRRPARSGVE